MDKTSAWNEIESKWKEIQVLWKDNFDIKNQRIKVTLKKNIPQIEPVNKAKRVKSQGFEIHFSEDHSNIVLSTKQMNASDLLRKFIEIVDVEKIRSLNVLTAAGKNLVVDIANDHRKIPVFTKTSNAEKKDAIRQIIQALNIKAKIIDIKQLTI